MSEKQPPCSYYEITCPRCGAPPSKQCAGSGCCEERFAKSRENPPLPPVNAREIAEAMQGYLASNACMLLFSKLTLYRATGENPEVRVAFRGFKFRVSLVRSNGEVEHFNRDGEP